MKGQKWIAYRGDVSIRDEAVAQMRAHAAVPTLQDMTVRGKSFYFYGWSRPRELGEAAHALWLPESLLWLGTWLYEGFPENEESTRSEIEGMIRLLEAFEVGRDLSWAPADICLQILDHDLGIAPLANTPELAATRAQIAEVLTSVGPQSDEMRELTARLFELERSIGDQIPLQWKADGKVQPEVYDGVRAAQVMKSITQLADDRHALYRAAERTAFGHNVREPGIRMKWLRSIFDAAVGPLPTKS